MLSKFDLRLDDDWKRILRYSWSIRLMLVAGFFAALEVGLPIIDGIMPIPPRIFAVLSILATFAAVVSRLVAQKSLGVRDGE